MYTMIKDVERLVCIPPAELGEDIDSIVDKLTWETYGGRLGEDKSFTVLIQNVRPVGPGRIVHGNGGVHQAVMFDQIVFKPEKAPVVQGRGLYRAYMNRKPLDLRFRAKTAGEADSMLQYLFEEQTKGKTLIVLPETIKEAKDAKTAESETTAEAAESDGDRGAPGPEPGA